MADGVDDEFNRWRESVILLEGDDERSRKRQEDRFIAQLREAQEAGRYFGVADGIDWIVEDVRGRIAQKEGTVYLVFSGGIAVGKTYITKHVAQGAKHAGLRVQSVADYESINWYDELERGTPRDDPYDLVVIGSHTSHSDIARCVGSEKLVSASIIADRDTRYGSALARETVNNAGLNIVEMVGNPERVRTNPPYISANCDYVIDNSACARIDGDTIVHIVKGILSTL